MRYHVPFAHRQHQTGPVYIGFDEPVSIQKRKGRFNWAAFMGLFLALISPFTLFLIAPLALLLSLFGLRRSPRGMAVVGLVFSLLATTALSLGIYGVATESARQHRYHQQQIFAAHQREEIVETHAVMKVAMQEMDDYRQSHDYSLPDLEDGMMMTVAYTDAWDEALSYQVNSDGCIIRSKGPDKEFHTSDDLLVKLDGKTTEWSGIDP